MAISQFVNKRVTQITGDGKAVTALSVDFNGTFQDGIEVDVPAGAVDYPLHLTIPAPPKLQLIVIATDQNISIKTNSTSAPQETIAVTGGNGLTWGKGDPAANIPIAGAVTVWYVSNPAITPAKFEVRGLFNEA